MSSSKKVCQRSRAYIFMDGGPVAMGVVGNGDVKNHNFTTSFGSFIIIIEEQVFWGMIDYHIVWAPVGLQLLLTLI